MNTNIKKAGNAVGKAANAVGAIAKKKRTWAAVSLAGAVGYSLANGQPGEALRAVLVFLGI